jgi:hypothetical protein
VKSLDIDLLPPAKLDGNVSHHPKGSPDGFDPSRRRIFSHWAGVAGFSWGTLRYPLRSRLVSGVGLANRRLSIPTVAEAVRPGLTALTCMDLCRPPGYLYGKPLAERCGFELLWSPGRGTITECIGSVSGLPGD